MINEKINKSFLNIISPPSFNKNLAITQPLNVPMYYYNKHLFPIQAFYKVINYSIVGFMKISIYFKSKK